MSDVEISAREAEVLAAVAEHRSNAQIARMLQLSVRTVESHVSSLLRKYGVADRRELAEVARSVLGPGMAGLPASRTSFVGRRAETARAVAALGPGRLVTLVGPGGMGKTRLAAAVAASAGVPGAFVDLVPVRAGSVVPAVATALDVAEQPPQPLEQTLVDRLRSGRTLLVLDNCEHLVDEVAQLAERALDQAGQLTVLATSRERLGIRGEQTMTVSPLGAEAAAALFTERARAVDPAFDATAAELDEICAKLEGMPLAIELAAARVASLGIDGLRTALGDRLRGLAGGRGADPRHRSLSAVIAWSHDLLDDDERLLLRRLAIYVGWFDLAAAAATSPEWSRGAVADLLGRLTDKNLVTRRDDRWRLLDTVREFSLAQLTAAELEAARERHLNWAVATAADLESVIDGTAWHASYDGCVGDLRAALAGTPAAPDPVASRLAGSLGHLTFARHEFTEAVGHYLAAADRAEDGAAAAWLLRTAADAAFTATDGPAALRHLLAGAERAAGHPRERATLLAWAVIAINRHTNRSIPDDALVDTTAMLAEAETVADADDVGSIALLRTARAWHQGRAYSADEVQGGRAVEAARRSGDPVVLSAALDALMIAAHDTGRIRDAYGFAAERMQVLAGLPRHDPHTAAEVVDAHQVAAGLAIGAGDLPAALALARSDATDYPLADHAYFALPRLIRPYALTGRFDECLASAEALWERWRQDGARPMDWMRSTLVLASMVPALRRDERLPEWLTRVEAITGDDSWTAKASHAFVQARTAVHSGATTGAYDAPTGTTRRVDTNYEPYAAAARAELAVVAGRPDAADRLAAAEPWAAENYWAAACLTRARGRQTGDRALLAEAADGFARIGARFERACTLDLMGDPEGRAELAGLGVPPEAGPA